MYVFAEFVPVVPCCDVLFGEDENSLFSLVVSVACECCESCVWELLLLDILFLSSLPCDE